MPTATCFLQVIRSHTPLPGHPGLKEHPWKQDMVSLDPAARPGRQFLGNQKALLKADQDISQLWQPMAGEQGGSRTCLLSVLAWCVCEGPASRNRSAFIS